MAEKKRLINLQLLRIQSAIMIIAFHCVFHGGAGTKSNLFWIRFIADFIYHFGELGVSCFILISGYFFAETKFQFQKFFLIVLETGFYVVISKLMLTALGYEAHWDLTGFFPLMRGEYWFVSVYLLIYILQPWLKQMLPVLEEKQLRLLLLSQIIIWSVLPTVVLVPVFRLPNTEAVPYYNRYIWFLILYVTGYYIRKYGIPQFEMNAPLLSKSVRRLFYFAPFLFLSIYIIIAESSFSEFDPTYFWPPNSLLMLIMSISLFYAFKNWKLKCSNRLIDWSASCALGIYLLHDGELRETIWNELLKYSNNGGLSAYILYVVKAVFLVFIAGMIVDSLRRLFETKLIIPLMNAVCSKMKSSIHS